MASHRSGMDEKTEIVSGDGEMKWLQRWWHKRQRTIDLTILWPACKRRAPTLAMAKAAFAFHAFHDAAWLELGEAEIERRIDELG